MSFRRSSASTDSGSVDDAGRAARGRRVRWAPLTVAAGVVATGALALSMSGTLAAFTAQITNDKNTAASGTLTLAETYTSGGTTTTCTSTDGGSVSTNAATCSTINKYGGSTTMVPGQTVTTTVSLRNTGTAAATGFTLAPTACQPGKNGTVNGSATDICTKMSVVVTETPSGGTAKQLYSGTLAGFTATQTLAAPAAGATNTYTFAVTLAAGADNTYQGLSASQQLVWNATAGS